jgi:multisubunit Na+/H+ antiporter MnhB subunit
MKRRWISRRWFVILAILFVAAVATCWIATSMAGGARFVFPWFARAGYEIVSTKEHYDQLILRVRVAQIAALVALVCLIAAAVFARGRSEKTT